METICFLNTLTPMTGNDWLKALCEEAGWHVEEDASIYGKHEEVLLGMPSLVNSSSYYAQPDDQDCNTSHDHASSECEAFPSTEEFFHGYGRNELKLSLSLSLLGPS